MFDQARSTVSVQCALVAVAIELFPERIHKAHLEDSCLRLVDGILEERSLCISIDIGALGIEDIREAEYQRTCIVREEVAFYRCIEAAAGKHLALRYHAGSIVVARQLYRIDIEE